MKVAEEIGYPVLVRPSYVLGGRAMEIIDNTQELLSYMTYVVDVSPKAPILVDKYIVGKEVEVDVIADGVDCLIPGIMEHIERAGVHSGDSMAVYPPQTLSQSVIDQMISHAIKLSKALEVKGVMNIQYVIENDTAYMLEVNPRASRTVPYLSKITEFAVGELRRQARDFVRQLGNFGLAERRPTFRLGVMLDKFAFAPHQEVLQRHFRHFSHKARGQFAAQCPGAARPPGACWSFRQAEGTNGAGFGGLPVEFSDEIDAALEQPLGQRWR